MKFGFQFPCLAVGIQRLAEAMGTNFDEISVKRLCVPPMLGCSAHPSEAVASCELRVGAPRGNSRRREKPRATRNDRRARQRRTRRYRIVSSTRGSTPFASVETQLRLG